MGKLTERELELNRAAHLRWYKRYPTRNATWSRERRMRNKTKLFKLLGDKCKHCGFTDVRALQLDHIEAIHAPVGSWHRGGTGLYTAILRGDFPLTDYQLLCANCNWIKKAENKEVAKPGYKYATGDK